MPIGNAICRIGSCLSPRTRAPLNLGRQISLSRGFSGQVKDPIALLKIYHLHLGIKFIVSKSNRNICPLLHRQPFINRQTFIYGPAVTIACKGDPQGGNPQRDRSCVFNYDITIEFQYFSPGGPVLELPYRSYYYGLLTSYGAAQKKSINFYTFLIVLHKPSLKEASVRQISGNKRGSGMVDLFD